MTGDSILVLLELTPIEEVQTLVEQIHPRCLVPYWWPNDPERTIQTAKTTMSILPASTRAGIKAIGQHGALIDFIEDISDQFDTIVLGPDNLGEHPNKVLYGFAAQGLFRGNHRFHLACGVVPTQASITYGDDFTSLRIEALDEQQRNRDV